VILGKPVAILGDAPCLDDITDTVALLANRFVIAINGACRRQPFHALCVADPVAIKFLDVLTNKHRLYMSSLAYGRLRFGWERDGLLEVMPTRCLWRNPQATVNVLMLYLYVYHGIKEVELYGFDMDGSYSRHLKNLREDAASIKTVSCCPSSKLPDWIERRRQPWT